MHRLGLPLTAMVAVLLAASPASAATGWSTPSKVWAGNYADPSVVVDAKGYEHIAARGDTGIWYLTNRTGSGDWKRVRLTRDVTDEYGGESGYEPQIALDPWDGSLTVAYVNEICCVGSSSLRYVTNRHPGGPGAWSAPRDLPGGSQGGSPSLVVRHGVIAVAAAAFRAGKVAFITNATGHWTRSTIPLAGAHWADDPSLALDSHGHPVIAYTAARTEDVTAVWLARGATRTGQFTSQRVAAGMIPSLVLDAHDQPRLAFLSDGTEYARRDASGWHVTRVMGANDRVELRLDRAGRPHIIAGSDNSGRAGLWYATKTAGTWHHLRLDTHIPLALSLGIALGRTRSGGPVHAVYQIHQRVWRTQSR